MLKRTTWLNIPRQSVVDAMQSLMVFDGAHDPDQRYATLMHGFSLEAKIPHPAPVLLGYGPSTNEFPPSVEESPQPRAFRLTEPALNTQGGGEENGEFGYVPDTLLSSKRGEVAVRRLALPRHSATPITEYADGDHVWYVYRGSGICYTDIGQFDFFAGEYVFIPKGFLSAFVAYEDMIALGIYAQAGFERPNISPSLPHNALREPYNEFDLRIPTPRVEILDQRAANRWWNKNKNGWRVDHVRGSMRYVAYYDRSPLACYGYQGTPYPFALPVKKVIAVLTPQVHTDPTWFTTFLSPDHSVAVSTFKERWVQSLPYHHRNTYDEFLFFAKEYGPRKGSGVGAGDAVFHPQGFMHGPQPEAFTTWKAPRSLSTQPLVDDCAIMFESRLPLYRVCWRPQYPEFEIPDYWRSWRPSYERGST